MPKGNVYAEIIELSMKLSDTFRSYSSIAGQYFHDDIQTSAAVGCVAVASHLFLEAAKTKADIGASELMSVSAAKATKYVIKSSAREAERQYAVQGIETAANEKPTADPAHKVERVAEGMRITRLAGDSLSPERREKLEHLGRERAAAVEKSAQARQITVERVGPQGMAVIRRQAQAGPQLATTKVKGPKGR